MTQSFRLTEKQKEANRLLAGHATHNMLRGGSRSGKTFLIVRAIVIRGCKAPGSRHAIWRHRLNHLKASIWADTLPKVMELCFPELPYDKNESDLIMTLPNGAEIWMGGLDDKARVEKVLGQEFATIYFNEASQIPWGSVETSLSRLAQKTSLKLKAYYDCNPPSKLHWSYELFKAKMKPGTKEAVPDPDDYVEMRINPDDNRENLPAKYFDVLDSMSAAKRKRFKDGEWGTEVEGALWSLEDRTADDGQVMPGLDSLRVADIPPLARIVVAVDPSGTTGEDMGDDIGIVVAGKGVDGRGYVLADMTCHLSPQGWGRRAVAAYNGAWSQTPEQHKADRIVGEKNYGGAMVEYVIRSVDKKVPYKEVHASRGKVVRAEPIAALYEQGLISHVGTFPDLEDQMCSMTPAGFVGEGSPDRLDEAVWALTELMLDGSTYDASLSWV